ncbi:putative transcriptional regulator [Lophiotrema nucula]|uniref:Putative transcriptional regulator n=1 Tax=Lophiotrema nucula TaxID=690887 RepID=A0A6A5YMR6_9PLEO|nr:putative transcriptional regulator [Lophiotrema nucula]
MHIPAVNAIKRPETLHAFVRQNPLGLLTTAIRSQSHPFLQASHIPWILDTDHGQHGRLRGHIARQNPQAKAIIENLSVTSTSDFKEGEGSILPEEVMIMFNGPVHHYITPQFYVKTKPETGKVVPTWDYEAVEVYGKARIYHDPKAEVAIAFLSRQIRDLSEFMERNVMEYETPWKVDDAPERYVDILMKNIIGIEIEITRIAGRAKWSQEKPAGDREGLIEGFAKLEKSEGAILSQKIKEQARMFDEEKARKKEEER